MNPKPTYIQLEAHEDAASVRDRLSFIRGKRVLLIWPEHGAALTRRLDLVLVQREARRRVIQIALVTHDPAIIDHARELGISTFETIDDAEREKWKRGRTRVFIQRHHKPEDEPDPTDLMPVASRVRNPRKRMPRLLYRTLQVVILLIVLLVVGGAALLTLPQAEIRLTVDQEILQIETEVIADPQAVDVNIEEGIVPATRVRIRTQTIQQIATTGIETGNNTRAIGVVTFSNNGDQPVEIPVGTRVATSTGTPVVFETSTSATIPPRDSVESVGIIATADYAGEIGNVDASRINTILEIDNPDLTVRNVVPTTGGVDQSYNVVALEDMDLLMSATRGALQAQAYAQIEANLSENQEIVRETLRIPEQDMRSDWITFSHTVGDVTDTLTLDMRAIVEVLVIDDRFARQIVFARLSQDIPDNRILNPDSFLFRRGPVVGTDNQDRTTLRVYGEGIAAANVDTATLSDALTGLTPQSAQRLVAATVELAPATQPEITIWPEFLGRLPLLPVRISFEIDGQR